MCEQCTKYSCFLNFTVKYGCNMWQRCFYTLIKRIAYGRFATGYWILLSSVLNYKNIYRHQVVVWTLNERHKQERKKKSDNACKLMKTTKQWIDYNREIWQVIHLGCNDCYEVLLRGAIKRKLNSWTWRINFYSSVTYWHRRLDNWKALVCEYFRKNCLWIHHSSIKTGRPCVDKAHFV